MRTNLIKAGAAALLMSLITVNQALASCVWLGTCEEGTGGATAVPEFDGSGAVAVIALLVTLVAVAYHRVKR